MRTTITISEALLRKARQCAATRGTTLSAVIEDALRATLNSDAKRSLQRFKLITFRGRGALPGIDLDKTSTLLDLDDVVRHRR